MNRQAVSWSFQESSLQRSFLWSLGITVLPVASGFVVSWVIARWAGPRVIGTVSWVMSFATAALILAKAGLDLAASRLASEYGVKAPGELRAIFAKAFSLRVVFTVLVAGASLVLATPLARFFGDATLAAPIRIGSLVIVCASLYEFDENFLVGLNRLGVVYKIRSLHLLSRIGFTIVLVLLGLGATTILSGYCAAWTIAIAAYVVLLWRYLPAAKTKPGSEGPATRRLLWLSVTLAVSSASVTIFSHMDRLMLGYFSGVGEVGQYAVARNVTEVTLFPAFAITMMLRPALAARYTASDIAACAGIIRKSLRYSLLSGVLFAAILAVLGVPLITVVYSEAFRYSGELMVLFVGVIVLRSLGSVILPALVAAERTKVYAYLTAMAAVSNFALNLVLIPRLEARGAVVATVMSYGLLLVAGLHQVFQVYDVRIGLRSVSLVVRTILAGSLPALLIWWFFERYPEPAGAFVWAGLLAVLYVFLIFAFRVGTFSDVRSLLINLRNSMG